MSALFLRVSTVFSVFPEALNKEAKISVKKTFWCMNWFLHREALCLGGEVYRRFSACLLLEGRFALEVLGKEEGWIGNRSVVDTRNAHIPCIREKGCAYKKKPRQLRVRLHWSFVSRGIIYPRVWRQ